jgi:hypothetical protein
MLLPRGRSVGTSRLSALSAIALTLLAVYVVTRAMAGGYLGSNVQQTIIDQTEGGQRNVLLAGRTEVHATAELFTQHPLGYGIAVLPSAGIQRDAVERVLANGGNNSTGYYQRSVFAGRVDLHSMASDLWANGGPGGIALAIVVLAILCIGIVQRSAARGASLATTFVAVSAAWVFLFGPMINIDQVGLALALVLSQLPAKAKRGPQQLPLDVDTHPSTVDRK